MRFKSQKIDGYQIFAVSGTNTVSFGIDFDPAQTAGLLGFAIERADPQADQHYYMYGFKVFEAIYPHPEATLRVSTFDQPMQSFVWDDFTAKPGQRYVYTFHPLKGEPKKLDRSATPIPITIETEPLYGEPHDVFFNRGVASSQAYVREFNNKKPDEIVDPVEKARALQWLSRDLDEALKRFIDAAKPGDALLGAFYEFRYRPAADWLKAASDRGVDVRLVIDAKDNSTTDKKGVFHEAFPRVENMKMVDDAGLKPVVTWREHNPDAIAHNKFLVLLAGAARTPVEVWTGSTNLSMGGIHGQTNVGHWVRDAAVARSFKAYWDVLSTDPGRTGQGTRQEEDARMEDNRARVAALLPTPTAPDSIAPGTTAVFSPRPGPAVLNMYATLLDGASSLGCITLAFGIGEVFKTLLAANTATGPMSFLLLEKQDKKKPNARKPFVALGPWNNVYQAWGSFIRDPLYRWTRETNARALELNVHVSYVHSKFLLRDPLGPDPIVVTGSANFSVASTNNNDENMLLIRGNQRVADIYFTEFNRLFFHYYFRSVHESLAARNRESPAGAGNAAADEKASLFLDPTPGWLAKYAPGTMRMKRMKIFTTMANTRTL